MTDFSFSSSRDAVVLILTGTHGDLEGKKNLSQLISYDMYDIPNSYDGSRSKWKYINFRKIRFNGSETRQGSLQ